MAKAPEWYQRPGGRNQASAHVAPIIVVMLSMVIGLAAVAPKGLAYNDAGAIGAVIFLLIGECFARIVLLGQNPLASGARPALQADPTQAENLAKAREESRRRHEEARERRRVRRERISLLPGRAWAGLGDVGQPVAIGLAIALPAVFLLVSLRASM